MTLGAKSVGAIIDTSGQKMRDRTLSNEPCPTGRLRLEVPQWIEQSSRGNFRLLESYYNLTVLFRHVGFEFFESPGRQNRKIESCSRDRALSNQPYPTGRFRLEVPQWIDFCSRGNFTFLESYNSRNMPIGHPIFDFFMTPDANIEHMTPLTFTSMFSL